MAIEYALLRKKEMRSLATFNEVESLAKQFLEFLRRPEIEMEIAKVHQLGASSARVQAIILPWAEALGFTNEKKGLFRKGLS